MFVGRSPYGVTAGSGSVPMITYRRNVDYGRPFSMEAALAQQAVLIRWALTRAYDAGYQAGWEEFVGKAKNAMMSVPSSPTSSTDVLPAPSRQRSGSGT